MLGIVILIYNSKDNVHIGKNSIIGAGSVVTHDIPENAIAVGNPARVIKIINLEK